MDTMTLWVLVAGATVGVFVASWVRRRHDRRGQAHLAATFDDVLTQRGQATLDEIAMIVSDNNFVLERYHARTREYRDAGAFKDATASLQHGCEAIERLAPDLIGALRTLNGLARSLSVIVALPPLRPYAFRAWELRGLAGLAGVLHNLLITGREKIMLRMRVLIYAMQLSVRWFRRSTNRLLANPEAAAEWKRIDDLVADLATAGTESEATAMQIVRALDAVETLRSLPPAEARGVGKA